MRSVTARAYANIALVKYWGKRDVLTNTPATPSLSLTVDQLTTTTTVTRVPADIHTSNDHFEINGSSVSEVERQRLSHYLDIWRNSGMIEGLFAVRSKNSFPTGAGLASSASGYAALATALSGISERRVNRSELSRLARRGSGSAARSIPGGIAALPLSDNPSSRCLVQPEQVPWGMVIAEVESTPKSIGSTEGMNLSRDTSPYYFKWLSTAKRDYRSMLNALKRRDFTSAGSLAEANSHAMHACMIATRPGLVYWNDVTIRLLHKLADWRNGGLETYATVDAGPHVCFLAKREDLAEVHKQAVRVSGVSRATINLPGPAAHIVEDS
jgi:diphosphomevalonate decarboxylase